MIFNMKANDFFKFKKENYITLDTQDYNGTQYLFTNKYDENEEPTQEFVVFKNDEDGLDIETNQEIINALLPKFNETLNKLVIEVNEHIISEAGE